MIHKNNIIEQILCPILFEVIKSMDCFAFCELCTAEAFF